MNFTRLLQSGMCTVIACRGAGGSAVNAGVWISAAIDEG
jgi:hypothetical protein